MFRGGAREGDRKAAGTDVGGGLRAALPVAGEGRGATVGCAA